MEEWGWWNKCNYRTLISATPEVWQDRGPSCKQIYSRGTGPPPPTLQPQSCPALFVKHLNDDLWWCKTYILIIFKQIESVGCLGDEEDDCINILYDGPKGDGLHGPPEAPPVLLVIAQGGEVGPEYDAVKTEGGQAEQAHQSHLDSLEDEEVSLLWWSCHSNSTYQPSSPHCVFWVSYSAGWMSLKIFLWFPVWYLSGEWWPYKVLW